MNICGDCTVCCTLSVVEEIEKKAWDTCSLCKNNGCSIYGEHPQVCKDFECAYLQGNSNEELRPDKCGIMFTKETDRIFTGIIVPGVKVTDIAKQQINSFNEQGFSVVLLKQKEKPFIRLAKGHKKSDIHKEYLEKITDGNL